MIVIKHASRPQISWSITLIVVSMLAVLYLQLPQLTDPYRVDGDFRSYYWMTKFDDPSLFPIDPTNQASYVTVNLFGTPVPLILTSLGYGLLFYTGSFFFTPLLFSKLLAFVVLPLSALYLYQFGLRAKNRATGVALAVGFILLILASPSSTSILPGLQRSWALSLIIPVVYYLHQQRYLAAGVTLLVCVLLYAPMFLLGAICWGFYALPALWTTRTRPQSWLHQRGLPILLGSGIIAILLMAPLFVTDFFVVPTPAQAAPAQSIPIADQPTPVYNHIWDNPVFQTGGKTPLFFLFPVVGRGGLVNNGEDGVHLLLMLSLGILMLLIRGRRALALPAVLWSLLWAGFAAFVLSWLAIWLADAFLLYLPSRYTRVSLLLFCLAFIVWNGAATLEEGVAALRTNRNILPWLAGGVAAVALGLIFFYPSNLATIGGLNMKWLLAAAGLLFAGLVFIAGRRRSAAQAYQKPASSLTGSPSGRLVLGAFAGCALMGWLFYAPLVSYVDILRVEPAERSLIDFVATLPKDSLLAGSACTLDNIPLFAQRAVLFNCDLPLPSSDVILNTMTAYYAADPQTIEEFCRRYNVSQLLINTEDFTTQHLSHEQIFFEPFHSQLAPTIVGRDDFLLAHPPAESVLFHAENYYVVDCLKGDTP
ncbi:MAG: hypothetical protein KDJ52_03585 [Anaerolineae bacterium]|nr:hypothetical protein [Anaerolineae bacterium]